MKEITYPTAVLILLFVGSCTANTEYIGSNNNEPEMLSPELCEKVNQYQDWELVNDLWVSEQFDQDRYHWRAGKGYLVKESKYYQKTDYDKYSTETLMRLAQDGDKAANLELAQRSYYLHSGSLGAAEHYCYMAVVDGFSAMTSCMISSYGEKYAKQIAKDKGQSSDKQFQLRLKLLGWIEVSQDFDDLFAQRFAESLRPRYQANDITPVMINDMTQTIHLSLNQARAERKKYKETLAVDVTTPMPDLWRYLEKNGLKEQVINDCFKESQYAKE